MRYWSRLIPVLCLGLFPALAQAASVTLAWDSSISTSVTGYRLHYGLASRTYTTSADVGNALSGTLENLTPGQTFFIAATAYDAQGNQSAYSNEVQYLVPGAPLPTTGLVAAYGFGQCQGTILTDSAGAGNHGTLSSGATWSPQGRFGNALTFDGIGGFVTMPHQPTLSLGTTGTIEAWVQLRTLGRWHGLIAKGNANNDAVHNYALEVTNSNVIRCILGTGASHVQLDSSSPVVAGQWLHVACTWDGSAMTLYQDGAPQTSRTQTLTPAVNTAPLFLGQFGGNSDRLDGLLDEVRVYNRALTATEIQADRLQPIEEMLLNPPATFHVRYQGE